MLLMALTLSTVSDKAAGDEYAWPTWTPARIDGVEHRCVDLDGYKALNHIWIDYGRLLNETRLLELELENERTISNHLEDQVRAEQELSKILKVEAETYRLSLDAGEARGAAARAREIALWVAVLGETAAIIILSLQR